MAIEIAPSDAPGLMVVRITREMTPEDQHALEALARAARRESEDVRALLLIDGFEGWSKSDAWGDDLGAMLANDDGLRRIAIVGAPAWRDEALAYAGQGFRAADVRYFAPSERDAADAWIRG